MVPLGLPHSRFLAWSPTDQDKALAYNREKATVCGRCGTRPVEWAEAQARGEKGLYDARTLAYVPHTVTCEGCRLLGESGEHENHEQVILRRATDEDAKRIFEEEAYAT